MFFEILQRIGEDGQGGDFSAIACRNQRLSIQFLGERCVVRYMPDEGEQTQQRESFVTSSVVKDRHLCSV